MEPDNPGQALPTPQSWVLEQRALRLKTVGKQPSSPRGPEQAFYENNAFGSPYARPLSLYPHAASWGHLMCCTQVTKVSLSIDTPLGNSTQSLAS